jgi:ubiquinone/menaquinone biosynthesis C-methylase UbiE
MSFQKLAPHYNWLESVLAQGKLQKCREKFISEFTNASNILLIGEGHGRFLSLLRRSNPVARIVCLDQSSAMLEQAQKRLRVERLPLGNIQFVVHDLFHFDTQERFDAIATHFFLDCFTAEQLQLLIPKINSLLRPAGIWNIADFQVPARFLPKIRAQAILALAYAFFRAATNLSSRHITNPHPCLKQAGLQLERRSEYNLQLLYSELWRKV